MALEKGGADPPSPAFLPHDQDGMFGMELPGLARPLLPGENGGDHDAQAIIDARILKELTEGS